MAPAPRIDPSVRNRIQAMTESAVREIDSAPDWHLPKPPPRFAKRAQKLAAGYDDQHFRLLVLDGRFRFGEPLRGERAF